MRPLARFEQQMERWLAAPAAALLRGPLHPVELAVLVGRALEEGAAVGVTRSYAPDEFDVQMHPEHLARYEGLHDTLERELAHYCVDAARERGLELRHRPRVHLVAHPNRRSRAPHIVARFQAPPKQETPPGTTAPPSLHLRSRDGTVVRVDRLPFRLGRALDNDAVLEDPRVSRHHAILRLAHAQVCVEDLRSTNGTALNGQAVTLARLAIGDILSLGGLELQVEGETA